MRIFLTFAILACFSITTIAQKKTVTINDNHGKITISDTVYNERFKDAILDVNKYIDTSKPIKLIIGNMPVQGYINIKKLRGGSYFPFANNEGMGSPLVVFGGESILKLSLSQGGLKITSQIDGFDGKWIARVNDNKLTTARSDYHLYVSDRYFELFDDYYIPVLQIELIKEANAIYIGGAFNATDGYNIISRNSGFVGCHFPESKFLIPQQKRDSLFNTYLQYAKKIQPIHE